MQPEVGSTSGFAQERNPRTLWSFDLQRVVDKHRLAVKSFVRGMHGSTTWFLRSLWFIFRFSLEMCQSISLWKLPVITSFFSLSLVTAVQSLHTLNDQISHFIVTKSKALEEDKDPFLPTEKETLKSSMILMRHLLMDAQVQRSIEKFYIEGCLFSSLVWMLSYQTY